MSTTSSSLSQAEPKVNVSYRSVPVKPSVRASQARLTPEQIQDANEHATKQIVMIYEDPITCTKPEGQARVIRFLEQVDAYIERYLVHFIGDHPGRNVERTVRRD